MLHNPIGQLYQRDGQDSLATTIHKANLAFQRNPHLSRLIPQECHVAPADLDQLPPELQLNVAPDRTVTLPVVPNDLIRPNHVWLCCEDPLPEVAA